MPYLLLTFLLFCFACTSPDAPIVEPDRPPNVIVILADDQGYADVGCYGSVRIQTPHLDRLATEGLKLTNFYAFSVCSPSRAALLTGCYPPRVGMPDVVGPPGPNWTRDRQYGLDPEQTTTLAELLRDRGYATAMVGKWHLGHFPETMPRRHGFETFYGLPYSNDMRPENNELWPDLPLLRNEDTLVRNPDQALLTGLYTTAATDFIRAHRDSAFFLYLAHSMPHTPLYASAEYAGRSGQGLYADVIEELDASVGTILATLAELDLDENTLVIYTSDNGPWLSFGNYAGSAGPFREGKGTTFEGGMRVPFLARWPAVIPAGTVSHTPASLLDILPTVTALAGAPLPSAGVDGRDRSALLRGEAAAAEEPFFYYQAGRIEAVRLGPWKLHLPHIYRSVDQVGNDGVRGSYTYEPATDLALYHLPDDPGEQYDLKDNHPAIVAKLQDLAGAYDRELVGNQQPSWRPVKAGDASRSEE